jgi:hypothetical protein
MEITSIFSLSLAGRGCGKDLPSYQSSPSRREEVFGVLF